MRRVCLNADPDQIVPKDSATLERYASIGIHANHMDMTKFSSDQDPDYRNVLSELQRFTQSYKQQAKERPPSASSASSEKQEQGHARSLYESSWGGQKRKVTESDDLHQPAKLVKPANIVGAPSQAAHPVTKNYRKVHVTIIHWKIDRLDVLVSSQMLHWRYNLRLMKRHRLKKSPMSFEIYIITKYESSLLQ